MPSKQSKSSAARSAAARKREKALALRIDGLGYSAIGRELKVTRQRAWQLVNEALEETRERTYELAELYRVLEAERLETMFRGLWEPAKQGDVQAVDRVIKIMDRRARLLGLDAPTKVAPTDPTGMQPYSELSEEEKLERIGQLLAEAEKRRAAGLAGNRRR